MTRNIAIRKILGLTMAEEHLKNLVTAGVVLSDEFIIHVEGERDYHIKSVRR